jgi:hypothetical protein
VADLFIVKTGKTAYNDARPKAEAVMLARFCVVLLILMGFAMPASAQFVRAFQSSAIFEPEIDVVNSGAVLDVQPTVSHDLKYVTMNMRAQNSQLVDLFTFQFQGPGGGVVLPGGVVGGVNPVVVGLNAIPQRPNAPMRVANGSGGAILLKRGITPLIFASN